ncbi:hypothetical protein DCS_01533 [Drechmeria coniospora]|uniref:Kinetochore protein mis13 n=1 Tax=Drechmeria coniospora TaxID=98403 RepID=A0A151GTE6_DRECN|nr:hypothetical protein DCS_01533 [Drechmeria coniospora]KYK60396.1 hypothetical protein DCS_01533 [Drechmeria coniospora]ODA80337.1 hypothetical protein RJ55_03295 [Drechmeria coniospora]
MSTLVATRQALEILSMNDQQKRRSSKRLAAATEYEEDDDFQFVRKSKRQKSDEGESGRKLGPGRPSVKDRAVKETSTRREPAETASSTAATTKGTATRRSSRRKQSIDEPPPDEAHLMVPKRPTRQSKRLSGEPRAEERIASGASRMQGRASALVASLVEEAKEEEEADEMRESTALAQVQSTKISLPMSDTPIISRNKDMRKKGNSNRRSSLGSRGRRASSLIESGQTAIPHREVDPTAFYKHIGADLMEPRRMKQLLMWCGERALSEKPPLGTPNANAILGARAIQDQLLKDFASRSEFSDWFARDDEGAPTPKIILKPNPRNIEMDEKLATLQEKVERLREEKAAWQAMKKLRVEEPILFSDETETDQIILPDFDLLDAEEGEIRGYLADEANSFASIRSKTESRLREIQSRLEFETDQLADYVHKLEQRVLVAGKEADGVLRASAGRLREREQRERTKVGTRDMPMMEVLRGLSSILPEGNGG